MASEFWDVVGQARARGNRCAEFARALERILSELSSTEIEAFARDQANLMQTSYRWDLWGAAFVINGGCSDDGFDDFRGWLMLQGRDVWEAALRDPESLAGVSFDGDAACEDVLYAASKAHEQVAGGSLPPLRNDRPNQPAGTPWQEEDLEALYPKLSKRFADESAPDQAGAGGFYTWDKQMTIGMALLASGAFESAATTFALVRQKAPRQLTRTIATNNLAWTDLMMDTPVALKEAQGLASEALKEIESEPQKAVYIASIKATLPFALDQYDLWQSRTKSEGAQPNAPFQHAGSLLRRSVGDGVTACTSQASRRPWRLP
jgi:hypothetical protein